MNILIFDTHKELIQFQATGAWAYEFVFSPELYSPNPKEVQNCINQSIASQNCLLKHSKIITPPKIWDIQAAGIEGKISALDLAPSTNPKETVGMLVVDTLHKKSVSMVDLDDGPLGEIDSIDLSAYYQNFYPTVFPTVEQQLKYIKKFHSLLEQNYFIDYEALTDNMPASAQLSILKEELGDALSQATLTKKYSSPKKNTYCMLNPHTTGWSFTRSLDTTEAPIKESLVSAIYEAGLLLTKEQEALWHTQHNEYNTSPLNLSFLEATRQKNILNAHIKNLSFSGEKSKRKI